MQLMLFKVADNKKTNKAISPVFPWIKGETGLL